jgi:hypothetical protein
MRFLGIKNNYNSIHFFKFFSLNLQSKNIRRLLECKFVAGEALGIGRSNDETDNDVLLYILPPFFTLILVAVIVAVVWLGLVRRKQKKRLGMAMTSGKHNNRV